MSSRKVALYAAALAASLQLISCDKTASQIGLLCKITPGANANGMRGGSAEVYEDLYSIDLQSKMFCINKCRAGPKPIFKILPGKLVLQHYISGDGIPVDVTINRVSGHILININNEPSFSSEGYCKKDKFAPFPKGTV
jgi:hypothetical protein